MKNRNFKNQLGDIHYEGNAFWRLLAYAKPYWKTVCICLILVLALTGLELVKPILIGDAIDQYITSESALLLSSEVRFGGILKAAFFYTIVLILLFFCNRLSYKMLQEMGQNIVQRLRNEVFEHVECLSMRFFDLTPVGTIVTRVTNDTEAIHELFANILVKLFRNSIKIIGIAGMMLVLNLRLALMAFIMVPVITVLTSVSRRLSHYVYAITKTKLTILNTFLSEHLSGMKMIQVFHKEDEKCREFNEKNYELYKAGFHEMMINSIFRPAIYLASVIALVIVLSGGSRLVFDNVITIGTLYIFTQYINQFFTPIEELAEQFTTLQSSIASAEKIFTLLDEKPLIHDLEEPKTLAQVQGKIEFDHVWFAYDNVNWVLKDVSFTIEPGQSVAFVGATGAGKSSILHLIGRYYDIQKGSIRIDGVDIKELSREQIRKAIGQVQQDVFIFTGDIAGNIRLREDRITEEAVKEAAEHTNASHFIEKLPNKYNEPVSERGATFSAGQRQLLSFARTLAKDPRILILDEATANIDTETEIWIQDAIEHLMKGRTTIMVAHRLSTIQQADRIIVMHHGRIKESGTHQELLLQNGIYKKLYQLQMA